jgi:hypothetical protein
MADSDPDQFYPTSIRVASIDRIARTGIRRQEVRIMTLEGLVMKSHLLGAVCAALFGFITVSSDAALVSRLGGLAYYDDVAKLTWLADANAGAGSSYDNGYADRLQRLGCDLRDSGQQ